MATNKDIWDGIQQTYSNINDASQAYEVKVKTIAAKKKNSYGIFYYRSIIGQLKPKCPEDAAILKDFIEQDVYDSPLGIIQSLMM